MKRLILLMAVALVSGSIWAQGPNNSGNYYQKADGKSGSGLRSAMGDIIVNHTDVGYKGLWNAYKTTDVRPDGKVRDWYSCKSNFVFGTDQCGNYKQECDCYNREHTVPQSWFSEKSPMKADVVHVVPTDGWVNNVRSDYPYGLVDPATVKEKQRVQEDYCLLGTSITPGYNGGIVFEPNDEIKGDLARIYFYMATCYYDKCGSWSGGIFNADGLVEWTMNLMMEWSKADPIDEVELARNEAVKEVQGNRNPFVDYPGLEDYIWGDKVDVPFSYDGSGGGVVTVAKPLFSMAEGTYYESITVSMTCSTPGASIYYTVNGGDAFYAMAQQVQQTAESSGYVGWNSSEGQKSRYWFMENHTNGAYGELHEAYYKYHRQGLDMMTKDQTMARQAIIAALNDILKVHKKRTNLLSVQQFMDVKVQELVSIFTPAPPQEQKQVYDIVKEVSPINVVKMKDFNVK